MSIVIFGADGYLGWPLTMRIARENPKEKIFLVDNLTRRRLVGKLRSDSVTPLSALDERIRAFSKVFNAAPLEWINLDVTSPEVDDIVKETRPRLVFHLAQVGSAAYSMKGPEEAVFTASNNELGNLRILWAVRRHAPEAHLIKSGSLGQYAKCGIDIAEGYYYPEYRGKKATSPAPFPRQADDVYHVSKINDSNYVSLACRKWGLRVTDVMQSTVFGIHTPETRVSELLHTRFDYDEYFGTVVNRFLAQVITSHPMSVYGSGWQRTGLMALEDAIGSVSALAAETPVKGQHRVVNHVTEKSFCIREIATEVQGVARRMGFAAEIDYGRHNPRGEDDAAKADYEIDAHYVSNHVARSNFPGVLKETLETLQRYADRIDGKWLPPAVKW